MNDYFDFLLIKKDLKGDALCTRYLNFIGKTYFRGDSKVSYSMKHENKELKLFHFPEYNKVEVAVNIPYFLLGNNYSITLRQEKHVIEYISSVIGTNLFKADADKFEYSSLFEIPFPFQRILLSHLRIRGMKTLTYDHGKFFRSRNVEHRIYDAGRNIKSKLTKQERIILKEETDYDENKFYIKVENRYTRPEIELKSRGILVETLFRNDFIADCKLDLVEKYQSIIKIGGVEINNKKQLTSDALYMIALKRLETVTGINTEQYLKDTIKSFSNILSKEDQKARIKQLKKNLGKIVTKQSEYDITDLLRASLG